MVRVVVVGGGVNGVGTAVALLQKAPQCQLTIISEDFTPDTTGDGAGGLWGPYLVKGTPEHKILSWGQDTWNLFRDWWKSGQNWGVCLVPGTVIFREDIPPEPWRHIPLAYTTLTQEQCSKYGPEYCTDTVVLGGTHQDDDWRREVDPTDSEAIWQKCTALMPSLRQSEVVREWVGLRPTRKDGIRVEADEIKVDDRTVPVVHNYGHGGCGISTFWGCSQEAAGIALDLIHKQYGPTSKL